jgi:hypothetical protein
MNKTFKSLNNFLLEMAGTPRDLYHYTNTGNLEGILKDGHLKTSDYEANVDTEKRVFHGKVGSDTSSSELATVRPSMAHKENVNSNLSGNIGLVKFIIKPHILSDKVRGVRVRPLAEFPLFAMKDIAEVMEAETGSDPKMANRQAKEILNKGREYYDKDSSGFISWLRRSFDWTAWEEVPTRQIYDRVTEYADYAREREGEERISLKKNNKIPLDSRYLKIELLKGFVEDFEEGYLNQTQYAGQQTLQAAQWKRRLEQWNSIFEKNDEYYKFSNYLTKILHGKKKIVEKPKPVSKLSKEKPVSINKVKKEQMKNAIAKGVRFKKGSIEKPIVMPSFKEI